jgi:imidazolonepropionase-like amidohydrolase
VVVIEDTTILRVGSGGNAPQGAAVIDLASATLLLGLVDTHVHLALQVSEPGADLPGAVALAALAAELVRGCEQFDGHAGVPVASLATAATC